jgi:hypothetical protein
LTSKEILSAGLEQAGLCRADVVLYIDEWLTGSNFHKVAGYLDRLIRRYGARLLPVGLLSEKAPQHERFATKFVPAHDRLCAGFGQDGTRFRHPFPPLPTRHSWEGYFFWGEQDWLAGYRKMQSLGTLYSVLDRTVEELRTSPDQLAKSKIALAESLSTRELSDDEIASRLVSFIGEDDQYERRFEESYQDYLKYRPEIERRFRASPFCWGTEDLEQARNEARRIIKDTVGKNFAVICLLAAAVHFKHSLSEHLEGYDRFHFRSHAPVLLELEGLRRALHEEWMAILQASLNSALPVEENNRPG